MVLESSLRFSKRVLALGLVAVVGVVSVVVACTTNPRAGYASGPSASGSPTSTSGGGGGGGGGGLDAAIPSGPIDCGPAPDAAPAFSKQALIAAAADCAAWHACGFQNAATVLRTNVREQATTPSADGRARAQAAWRGAMDAWSKMELFQFGPMANKATDKYHGRGLRSFVHPWPDLNRCQVETQIATKAYTTGWDAVLPSGRGLFAAEYGLYYDKSDIVCQPASGAAQTWAAFGPAQLTQAKNDYAVAIADNLAALSLEIARVWAPDGENFKPKLVAFEGYGTDQEALNVIAWSLIYAEQEIKDLKLAPRAGVQTSPPNPETPFALVDVENVRTNMRAFRSLFEGCGTEGKGLGFDDWLIAAGHPSLASEIVADLDRFQAAVDAFPPFQTATQARFLELYGLLRPLSNLLKTSFFGSASPLNLKLPATAASDTD